MKRRWRIGEEKLKEAELRTQGRDQILGILEWFFGGASILGVFWLVVQAYFYSPVWPDTGYTLPMAERISEGVLPFRDLGVQHTTSLMFALGLADRLLGGPLSYESYLAIDYTAVFIVFCFIFWLSGNLLIPLRLRILLLSQLALANYAAEGWTFDLEPFVLVFGFSGLLIGLGNGAGLLRAFGAGLAFGVAITLKQYGLFLLGGMLLTILFDRISFREKFQQISACAVGAGIPLIAYYGYLSSLAENGIRDVLWSATGRWYSPEPEHFGEYLKQLIWFSPFLLIIPFQLWWSRSKPMREERKLFVFSMCCLLLSCCQGFVRQYPHYLIHSIPFATLLLAIAFKRESQRRLLSVFLLFACLTAGYKAFAQYKAFIEGDARSRQRAITAQIHKTIPPRSRVLVMAPPSFQYLGNFLPAGDRKPGYNFLHNYSGEEMKEMLGTADYVLTWPGDEMYFVVLARRFGNDEGQRFYQELDRRHFLSVSRISDRWGNPVAEIFRKEIP